MNKQIKKGVNYEKNIFFLLLTFLFFFYSCNVSSPKPELKDSTETETKELLDTLWVLESFEINGDITIPPKEQIYNIHFRAYSTLTGQNDCNKIVMGKYSLGPKNVIKVISMAITKMLCGSDSMDDIFSDAIYSANSFRIDKNQPTIYYKTNSKLFFNRE